MWLYCARVHPANNQLNLDSPAQLASQMYRLPEIRNPLLLLWEMC